MREEKLVRLAVANAVSQAEDNAIRARTLFARFTPEQMQKQYGQSGRTHADILQDYEEDLYDWQQAQAWLNQLIGESK